MAAECCDVIIGGRIEVRVEPTPGSPGQTRVLRGMGDFRIQPQMLERTAGMTNDGKLFVTMAPRPARAVGDYANACQHDPYPLLHPDQTACRLHVTVEEVDRDVTHRFTNAVIVGFAEYNLSSGVISGIEIVSDQYSKEGAGVVV